MTEIKLKRVYDENESSDGFRILVDRLWPRGIKKENLKHSLWAKEAAPSTELRKWFHENSDWDEFKKRYLKELESSAEVQKLIETIKTHKIVTLLYSVNNTRQNHAMLLREYILSLI